MGDLSRGVVIAAALVTALTATAWAATNLNSSKSNVYRVQGAVVVSATVSFPSGRDGELLYTTSKTGELVLTQFCASAANGGIRLSASGFGPIAHTGSTLCYAFNPGVSLPKGSDLSCSTPAAAPSGDYFCTISGLQTN